MSNAKTFQAPVGTRDILAPESDRWIALIASFSKQVLNAGFGFVQSPMFEEIGVFQRLGEGTDVVRKEMYDFVDKGDRHLALRPEGTASIVRAFVEHRPTLPFKAFYVAPNFRYERPQAGRYRQHHQLGVEALGSDDPELDIEILSLGWEYLASLGLTNLRLLINSMGTRDDRLRYVDHIQQWLKQRLGDLDPADQEKVADHPMRVLDSKRQATRAVVNDAPMITDLLSNGARERFAHVCSGLDDLAIPYTVTPTLVRGLDYYTHTTFEIVADSLDAAQSTILGGGRYDGLVAQMGGPETPGIGFGSGIERVLLACDAEGVFGVPERDEVVFVVDVSGGEAARSLCHELRREGITTERGYDQRSLRAQMKLADRSGARFAILIGPEEVARGGVTVRDLRASSNDANQVFVERADAVAYVQKSFDALKEM